jgi:lysophospholipase L1-like esterase
VGDELPDGSVRGWADFVAAGLATAQGEPVQYANLAIRGRKLAAIVDEQVGPALALQPDLVTIYAGANDILRPKVDIDALAERYDAALTRIAGTGARLVVFTAFDPAGSAIYRPLRGRFALYNEFVRDSARRLGADLVDFWRLREYRDWRYWDADRMHLGPAGHQRMAIEVLDTLAVPHDLRALPLVDAAPLSKAEQRRENLDWVRTMAVPWVHRRLTGRSSGDGLDPKRSTLQPID